MKKKRKNQNQPAEEGASITETIPTDSQAKAQLRVQLNVWLEQIAMNYNWQDKKILEIGIAGDEKPSGSHKFFGHNNDWTTLDINEKWQPDIVADITDSGLADESFDIVIMTQTLEHIWDFRKALSEIARITGGYAIIDCPLMFPFHQDKVRMGEHWSKWDDYIRLTPAGLRRALLEAGFEEVDVIFNRINTLAICRK